MQKKLGRNFFRQKTLKVAKDLLGKIIVRKIGKGIICGRIMETEAYIGENDKACHLPKRIACHQRIGVSYAAEHAKRKWRVDFNSSNC
ncbi:MAG: DNA-3-methyladenine glycosylase [Candidatus Berkelbacteria bacterium]|nr:DNA-3-methyladenine glycosylase [Candidatus Berkelbacteria bacterium]